MKDLRFESSMNLYGFEYIDLFLSNCKGWQRRMDKGMVENDLRSEFLPFYQTPPTFERLNLNLESHQATITSFSLSRNCPPAMPFIGSHSGSSILRRNTTAARWIQRTSSILQWAPTG
jgi:hypothetical protein